MSVIDHQAPAKQQASDPKAGSVVPIDAARRARKNREMAEAQNWLIERAKKLGW